jgi:hypothetical protein
MTFRIGNEIHVHADARVQLAPNEGPNARQPFTVRAAKSLSADNGAKAIVITSAGVLEPVAVALASAEPSFSLGLDVMQVSTDYALHCGNGYQRMSHTATIVFNRPGLPPITFTLSQVIIEKGFGLKSDAGGQPTDEISGKFRRMRIKYKGKTLDPFALPGSVPLI